MPPLLCSQGYLLMGFVPQLLPFYLWASSEQMKKLGSELDFLMQKNSWIIMWHISCGGFVANSVTYLTVHAVNSWFPEACVHLGIAHWVRWWLLNLHEPFPCERAGAFPGSRSDLTNTCLPSLVWVTVLIFYVDWGDRERKIKSEWEWLCKQLMEM